MFTLLFISIFHHFLYSSFFFFFYALPLSYTHTSVLAMMESSSALLTGSLMKRIRVLSSTSGLSTPILYRKHTQRCAHTQVQVDSHALAINPTETVNKTEVQLCIQVCSAFNSGYYKLHFKLCKHKMSESIKGLNYAYWSLFSMQLP